MMTLSEWLLRGEKFETNAADAMDHGILPHCLSKSAELPRGSRLKQTVTLQTNRSLCVSTPTKGCILNISTPSSSMKQQNFLP